MKTQFILLAGLFLIGMVHACHDQASDIATPSIQTINDVVTCNHIKVQPTPPVQPEPPTMTPIVPPIIEIISVHTPSSHGPSKTYAEHKAYCAAHRNFDFKTRTWNNVPSLSKQKCQSLWENYLSKQKIKINSYQYEWGNA